MCLGNTAPFEEMSQRWRAVGNTVSDSTGPRFELQTSRSRDERVTARPTGRFLTRIFNKCVEQETFPNDYKIAYVVPIPKVSSPQTFGDF